MDHDFEEQMDTPCVCEHCSNWFDQQDGNPCSGGCSGKSGQHVIYCEKCVPEPWGLCPSCREGGLMYFERFTKIGGIMNNKDIDKPQSFEDRMITQLNDITEGQC